MAKFLSEAVLIEHDGRVGRYLYIRIRSHAYNHQPTHPNNQPKDFSSIHLFVFALVCVASVSVWFRSKERPRKGIFGFSRPRSLLQNRTETLATQAMYAPIQSSFIRHFRNEKGTGAKMHPAGISGIVTGDALVSYWLIFSHCP